MSHHCFGVFWELEKQTLKSPVTEVPFDKYVQLQELTTEIPGNQPSLSDQGAMKVSTSNFQMSVQWI